MKLFNLFAAIAFGLMSNAVAQANVYGDLSPEDQDTINRGAQVVQTEDMEGSAWPAITVIQRIDATADQVAAVLFDYALHKSMFEGITQSTPKNPGALETEVVYTMTFPKVLGITLPDETYTVLDKLSTYAPGAYEISWTMVKAMTVKDTTGSVKFEQHGTGMIVSYTNFISPPRPALAKMIVEMAINRVKDTVTALEKQVQAERAHDQARLNTQLGVLHKALGQ